ncbi:MAG TPA: DUF2254 domain-containing protein [Planctomycetota bacterium]|nr:DUF2254 domain-containing protein [Planctomycetota bacterium]
MTSILSLDRLRFLAGHLRERLWLKPLAICLASIGAAFVAKFADTTQLGEFVPQISAESLEYLLSVMASSMLLVATFAVASMIAAYGSASRNTTPRSFPLVVADDVSQNALSTFIGSFIYSIVALTSLKHDFFGKAALFTLFALTVIMFAIVIVTFVRWVDRIARLGRLGETVDTIEEATCAALERRRCAPTMGCAPPTEHKDEGVPVFDSKVGYVQHIDVKALQKWAAANSATVVVELVPGGFATPDRALARVHADDGVFEPKVLAAVADAFTIGGDRRFDSDPRFGLVVLAETAARALSPAVNDMGTAIDILGTLVRLFVEWSAPRDDEPEPEVRFERVQVPRLSVEDMTDDAFTAIARDGAGLVEVGIRLQKALNSRSNVGDPVLTRAAQRHARLALARAERAGLLPEDLEAVRAAHRA